MLVVLKLALVAASILGASLFARRFGHTASGALAGLPVIVGPIIAILLIDLPAERVRMIALATLACVPATLAHIVGFAHAARRFAWPVCLVIAVLVFGVVATALSAVDGSPFAVCAAAIGALLLAAWWLPARGNAPDAPVPIPASELWWRLGAALTIAATVMWGADHLPMALAGALLAFPISGSVLPCFTLPRHGPEATVRLLSGFVRGLRGFVGFFVALIVLLPLWPTVAAFAAAVATGMLATQLRRPRGTTDAS